MFLANFFYYCADFYEFYDYIRSLVSPVFAYPAYVTGVLMFYSGMLVKNAITKKQDEIDGSWNNKTEEYKKKNGIINDFEYINNLFTKD